MLPGRVTLSEIPHPATDLTPAWIAELDQPVGLGAVMQVDTARPVDLEALVAQIANLLAR